MLPFSMPPHPMGTNFKSQVIRPLPRLLLGLKFILRRSNLFVAKAFDSYLFAPAEQPTSHRFMIVSQRL